NCRIKTKF
ncbi:Immunoglobulin A1 protease autotransporter precursor, partial [Haemophilus influenzae]